MGNLEETKPINKIIIEANGDEYEFTGGQPGPDSVGSEQIQDGAVQEVDLHDDVKEKLNKAVDDTPTANSKNLVTSGGVKAVLDGCLKTITREQFDNIFKL